MLGGILRNEPSPDLLAEMMEFEVEEEFDPDVEPGSRKGTAETLDEIRRGRRLYSGISPERIIRRSHDPLGEETHLHQSRPIRAFARKGEAAVLEAEEVSGRVVEREQVALQVCIEEVFQRSSWERAKSILRSASASLAPGAHSESSICHGYFGRLFANRSCMGGWRWPGLPSTRRSETGASF